MVRDREAETQEHGRNIENNLDVLSILPCGCVQQEEKDIMAITILCNWYGARLKQELTSPCPQGDQGII